MIKIVFQGTAPGCPQINKRHSCLYVQYNENYNFLLDAGEGACFSFIEYIKDVNAIDFIFITHFHPDHSSGIFMLLQTFQMLKRTKKLTIFTPEQSNNFKDILKHFYLFPEKFTFELEILDCEKINDRYNELVPFLTDHLQGNTQLIQANNYANEMKSFGLNINTENKVITYTSDIVSVKSILDYLKNTDICIIDGIHPILEEFLLLDNVIKEKIYITHGSQTGLKDFIIDKPKFVLVNDKDELNVE
jgi:ribonuclease BN (tRNA processing enzyme)